MQLRRIRLKALIMLWGKGLSTADVLTAGNQNTSREITKGLKEGQYYPNLEAIDFTDEVTLLSAETLKGYKMLIVFRDGMLWPNGYGRGGSYAGYTPGNSDPIVSVPPLPELDADSTEWLTAEQGLAVKEFVENGGAAFFSFP